MDGIYPFPPLYDDPRPRKVGDITYELWFEARETWWQYYVVCQTPGSKLFDLEISGKDASFELVSKDVPLPNGETATLFQSTDTLALREIPPERFTLTGLRRDARGKVSRIKVEPLPAALSGRNPDGSASAFAPAAASCG